MNQNDLIELLALLPRLMRERHVNRIEARVIEPHPYPDVAGVWADYLFAIDDQGQISVNGVTVSELPERLRYLLSATRHRVTKTMFGANGEIIERAA